MLIKYLNVNKPCTLGVKEPNLLFFYAMRALCNHCFAFRLWMLKVLTALVNMNT